jgi:hypothetical protein
MTRPLRSGAIEISWPRGVEQLPAATVSRHRRGRSRDHRPDPVAPHVSSTTSEVTLIQAALVVPANSCDRGPCWAG